MPVTPTTILNVPTESLRNSLSTMTSVQTFLNAADAAAALAKIYPVAMPRESTPGDGAYARPFILVSQPMRLRIGRGGFTAGRLWLLFEADVPSQYAAVRSDAHYWFTNLVGAVLVNLPNALEQSGALLTYPVGITSASDTWRSDETDEAGDYMSSSWWIEYGPDMME